MSNTGVISTADDKEAAKASQTDTIIREPKEQFRLIAAATIGYCVELFDFTVYSFFAAYIGQVFFAAKTGLLSLLISLSVFAVGFVARPLGAVVLGIYADKHGRRACMSLSIFLMGLGCVLIACAPTPAMVGPVLAPGFIVVGRLIQGFSAGGELSASMNLLLESAPKNRRGFFLCWPDASQGISTLAGAALTSLLIANLSYEQMLSFGWRIPFVVSLLIIPVGLYIRRNLHETLDERKIDQKRNLLAEVFTTYRVPAFLLVAVVCHAAIGKYTYLLFIVHYANNHNVGFDGNFLSTCASIAYIVGGVLGGPIADKIRRNKVYIIFMLSLLAFSAGVAFCSTQYPMVFFFGFIAGPFCLAIATTAVTLMLLTAFPQYIRSTAFGTMNAINITIFGGTAQMVMSYLLIITNNRAEVPFYYMLAAVIVSIIAIIFYPYKGKDFAVVDDNEAVAKAG